MNWTQDKREQQRELIRRLQGGDESAAGELVSHNAGLLDREARRVERSMGLDFDDCRQEGAMAMLKAAKMFQLDAGTEFSSYATVCIRYAMQHHAAEAVGAVRIPRNRRNKVPEGCLSEAVSLEKTFEAGFDLPAPAFEPDPREELRGLMEAAGLSGRERVVVRLAYGLNEARRPWPLRRIGDRIRTSHETVRTIRDRAVEKMTAVAECDSFEERRERLAELEPPKAGRKKRRS